MTHEFVFPRLDAKKAVFQILKQEINGFEFQNQFTFFHALIDGASGQIYRLIQTLSQCDLKGIKGSFFTGFANCIYTILTINHLKIIEELQSFLNIVMITLMAASSSSPSLPLNTMEGRDKHRERAFARSIYMHKHG
uniref:Uncharacterized protein n=1 Tax=Salix viminalis TaxID=40686 RepID=A0A6N2KQW6_SALVM